jgi:tRNA nucleotidyltransferase (CCA-adding enzyme)
MGVRGFGPTMAVAFEQAAVAMMAVITNPAAIGRDRAIEITAEAPNADFLLLDWLNALVFEMATRGMIFGSFDVVIDGVRLRATARGEALSRERHAPAVEIKGATLTELRVVEDQPGLWRAQCVVDV